MIPEIRDFRESDISSLVPFINDEWHFDLYGPEWERLVAEYVAEYVSRSDFSKVAVYDGIPVGIVTASVEVDPGASARMEMMMARYPGNGYITDQKLLDSTDEFLRSQNDMSGSGELVLLIVSSDMKGKGIGRMLLGEAASFLKNQGCRGMQISTDTDCNYGFYEHLGAELLGSREIVIQGKPIIRFLYSLEL